RTGKSCGGGRTAGGSALVRGSWRSLLRRFRGRRFIARWPAVATGVAPLAAGAEVAPLAPGAGPAGNAVAGAAPGVPVTIAIAVAIDLAHHHRRPFFVLVDAHREIAQHVLVEPLLTLDLVHRRRRRIEIHERVVRLAVLAQAVGKRFDAPLFELGDLAAQLLDDAFELGGQFFDLLRAHTLPVQGDVFVKRHAMPSLVRPMPTPGGWPFEPFRERLESSEGGNGGGRASRPCRRHRRRPSVQLPAGIERKPG